MYKTILKTECFSVTLRYKFVSPIFSLKSSWGPFPEHGCLITRHYSELPQQLRDIYDTVSPFHTQDSCSGPRGSPTHQAGARGASLRCIVFGRPDRGSQAHSVLVNYYSDSWLSVLAHWPRDENACLSPAQGTLDRHLTLLRRSTVREQSEPRGGCRDLDRKSPGLTAPWSGVGFQNWEKALTFSGRLVQSLPIVVNHALTCNPSKELRSMTDYNMFF